MLKSQKGFTLVELIVIIVIIGILAAIAIPMYIDLAKDARDGTARGILGTLRSANALVFGDRIVKGSTATYTADVIAAAANIQGAQITNNATYFTVTIGGDSYSFTLAPTTLQAPTTPGTIAGPVATW